MAAALGPSRGGGGGDEETAARRASSQVGLVAAPHWMWHKGPFWLTASVQADPRCLDLPDLKYTTAFWAAALNSLRRCGGPLYRQ